MLTEHEDMSSVQMETKKPVNCGIETVDSSVKRGTHESREENILEGKVQTIAKANIHNLTGYT